MTFLAHNFDSISSAFHRQFKASFFISSFDFFVNQVLFHIGYWKLSHQSFLWENREPSDKWITCIRRGRIWPPTIGSWWKPQNLFKKWPYLAPKIVDLDSGTLIYSKEMMFINISNLYKQFKWVLWFLP
jgi:hypothetical protein